MKASASPISAREGGDRRLLTLDPSPVPSIVPRAPKAGVFKNLNHWPADPVASMARHYVEFGDGGDWSAKLQIMAER